jgi:hypothetical protein
MRRALIRQTAATLQGPRHATPRHAGTVETADDDERQGQVKEPSLAKCCVLLSVFRAEYKFIVRNKTV